MSESGTPGKQVDGALCGRRRLFEFGDAIGADLMDDAAEFLDPFAEPGQLFFADPVVLGLASLGVSFFELLEHRPLAMCRFWPDAEKTSILTFGEGTQEGDIVVIWRVICQR